MSFRIVSPIALSAAPETPSGAAAPAQAIQLLRVGKFSAMSGPIEITKETLKAYLDNFNANVRKCTIEGRTALPLNYNHNTGDVAAGWLYSLELRNNDAELWGMPEWTPAAAQKIKDKEFSFTSIEGTSKYVDPETGKNHGHTLFGVALTNTPAANGMQNIKLNEGKETAMVTLDQVLAFLATADAQAKVAAKAILGISLDDAVNVLAAGGDAAIKLAGDKLNLRQGGDAVLLAENVSLKGQIVTLSAENETFKKEKKLSEKTKAFEIMLKAGQACEAQRVAFMADDFAEFAKNSMPIAMSFNQQTATPNEAVTTRMAAFNDLDTKAKAKAKDDKVDYDVALSDVMRANPQLAAAAGY